MSDGSLDTPTFNFAVQKHNEKNKMIANIYKAFKVQSDMEDFLHSIKRFYKKNAPPAPFIPIPAPAV